MDLTAIGIPVLIFGAIALAAFGILSMVLGARSLAQRLDNYTRRAGRAVAERAPKGQAAPELQLLRQTKYSNFALLDQMISRRSWAEREAAELARADIPLRVGEYLLLRWMCAAGLAVVGFVAGGNALFAVPAGLIGYFIPGMWVKQSQNKRRRKFEDQLVEAMMLLASSMRSGYSFLQGMEAITREMKPPVAEEFNRLIQELGIGANPDDSLLRLIDRVRSDDLELVVTAIMIQRQVGGELAGILDNIVKTVRERQRIKRDIQTLTAQQRWSGYIIGALPIIVLIVIWMFNRSYTDELFFQLHGQAMLGIAAVLEVAGFYMIRRIIDIEV